ncbi:MAG: glycosyltransferase [Bacteroidetes bacterium CHB5]|nr:glycosyltransferase [Bacteroidetes bacterium CHB5]
MILGFHYHIPACEKNGKIVTSGFLGVFLDSLATNVSELVCFMHSPVPGEDFLMDYTLRGKNIRLVSMGPHNSVPQRLFNSRKIMAGIAADLARIDLLLIRCPTPLLPSLSRVKKVKKAYLIVGDYQKSAKDLRQPLFRKFAIQGWAYLNNWWQNRAIKNALVFVNSGLIYEELKDSVKNLHLVRTTTLQASDFFSREDTCQSKTINLLYTGRLDLSKGLVEMIEALNRIRLAGVDAQLHFVGWEDKNTTEVTDLLRNRAVALGLESNVFFHGKKQVGAELNTFYRMADIYIIGSKSSEGFPRTIWEAMANSVPVIASSIGSIPIFLRADEEVLLFEPGSVDAMTDTCLRILQDSALRMRLIRNGFEMAQSNTLEKQTNNISRLLHEYSGN